MITYEIAVRGQVDVDELNAASPHHMTLIQVQPSATLFTIFTDQSGLIGLLRHLHNLGLEFLAVSCQRESGSTVMERTQ